MLIDSRRLSYTVASVLALSEGSLSAEYGHRKRHRVGSKKLKPPIAPLLRSQVCPCW